MRCATRPRETRSTGGFTQIELMVAAVLVTVIAGATVVLFSSGMDAYRSETSQSQLERLATRVVDRIADEISMSGRDVLYPAFAAPQSGSSLTLQQNRGWSEGAIVWGPPVVIELVPATDDPDDGIDNNGNGLVDEGMIVMRVDVGSEREREVILTRWVRECLEGEEPNGHDDNGNGLTDEKGLALDLNGEVWTVRLTLARQSPKGRLLTHTAETSVRPRN